jgi:RNA polymerase sigma factor (sigma-70 family)
VIQRQDFRVLDHEAYGSPQEVTIQAHAVLPATRLVVAALAPLNAGMPEETGGKDVDLLAELLSAVAERQDRLAFARLFGHFAPRIKAYVRRLGVAEERAEDLVQEVMLTVWRRAGLYDRRQASVGTWVFTIARNKRIDEVRRERRPEVDPEDPALLRAADVPADQTVLRAQSERRLQAAVSGLPDEQAAVLRMSFFEDKPHSIIAGELDLPLGTVKSRLRLALGKLRDALEDMDR